jgi:hypothetical protein
VVFNRSIGKKYGHHIGENAKNGFIHELLLSNASDNGESVKYRLEKVGAFPDNFIVSIFNPLTKKLDVNRSMLIKSQSTASRWLIAGDVAFHEQFLNSVTPLNYSLHKLYPNPSRSIINIRYSVPLGANEQIRIAIYNVIGKKVWEKRVDGFLREGIHQIVWDGRNSGRQAFGSGIFIVQLLVVDAQGRVVKNFRERLTFLR